MIDKVDQNKNKSKKNSSPKRTFDFNASIGMITIQHVKESCLDSWKEKVMKLGNVMSVLIGREENKDKGIHLHIVIQFEKRRRVQRSFFENVLSEYKNQSINIKPGVDKGALINFISYSSKVGDTIQHGEFSYKGRIIDTGDLQFEKMQTFKDKNEILNYFYKLIEESGKKPGFIEKLVLSRDPKGMFLALKPTLIRQLKDYERDYKEVCGVRNKPGISLLTTDEDEIRLIYLKYLEEFPQILKDYGGSSSCLEDDYADHIDYDMSCIMIICKRLSEMIKYKWARPRKTLNLFISSNKPNWGKTYLLDTLSKYCPSYHHPEDRWYVKYLDETYWFIRSDESSRMLLSKGPEDLNLLFEGQIVELDRKLKEKIYKEDNPMFILCSNQTLSEILQGHKRYREAPVFEAPLRARIQEVILRSRAMLFFIADKLLVPLPK